MFSAAALNSKEVYEGLAEPLMWYLSDAIAMKKIIKFFLFHNIPYVIGPTPTGSTACSVAIIGHQRIELCLILHIRQAPNDQLDYAPLNLNSFPFPTVAYS